MTDIPAPQADSHHVSIGSHKGLTSAEAIESRKKHGNNVLTPPPRIPWWKLFLEKFDDPVIRILLAAAVISLVAGIVGGGHYVEPIGILIAVFLATFLAFINEYQAASEFDILNQVNDDVPVKVVRDGLFTTVPRRDVVVGDLVLLEAGDEVPADGELIEAIGLQIDESKLTGESLPASKYEKGTHKGDEKHTYKSYQTLRSTLVADGHGTILVTAVGDESDFGKTARAAMVSETGEVTPLNHQLDRLAKLIGVVGFSIAGVTFAALFVRAVVTGDLTITPPQWWFLGVAGLALVVAIQKIWVPIWYDAKELLDYDVEPPEWLEKGGLQSLLRTTGAGVIGFAVGIGALILLNLIPSDPAQWLTLGVAQALLTYFMIAVVIVVVAVPEGLAMSVTLSLAYSMRKMTASNNLVRRMHACETIGAATVICSDKTGTLTENRMRVHECRSGTGSNKSEGFADEAGHGKLLADGIAVNSTANLSFDEEAEQDGPTVIGNPTEGALLLWSEGNAVDYLKLRNGFAVEHQWAFHTKRKFMVTVGKRIENGVRIAHIKGAPEIVMNRCARILGTDGKLVDIAGHREALSEQLKSFQTRGMRTLGLAFRELGDESLPEEPEDLAVDATWLGFFAIADPVRSDVPDAVKAAQQAGIGVKIVTGDIATTAAEIGRQVGLDNLDHPDAVLTGPEFGELDDETAKKSVDNLRILSRARPADKMRLVQLLQGNGHVVAVTGDGTNDAPALNYANVGLAMGKSGTSIAKEASDIVLLDDSFSSIVNAVKWGRSLYLNIQRFVLFQLTINVAACIIAMLGPFIGIALPLTVMQMLWVNLIMDTFAALALATEPPSDEVLRDKPRDAQAFIISKPMAKNILITGGIFVILLLGLLKTNLLGGTTELHTLTLFFNFFVFLQFWNLFNARTLGSNKSGLSGMFENKSFVIIAGMILLGQFLIIQVGGTVFRTEALSATDWLKTVGFASPVLIVGELIRWQRRSAAKRQTATA